MIIGQYSFYHVIAKMPGISYETVLQHVATHGYVIITPQKLEDAVIALNATWIDNIDEWAQKHLHDKLVKAGNIIPDTRYQLLSLYFSLFARV